MGQAFKTFSLQLQENTGAVNVFQTFTITIGPVTSGPPTIPPQDGQWSSRTAFTIAPGSSFSLLGDFAPGLNRTARFSVADGRVYLFPSGVSMLAAGLITVVAGTPFQVFTMKIHAANDGFSDADILDLGKFDDRNTGDAQDDVGRIHSGGWQTVFIQWNNERFGTDDPDQVARGGYIGPLGDDITPFHTITYPTNGVGLFSFSIPTIANRWLDPGMNQGVAMTSDPGLDLRVRSREHTSGPPAKIDYTPQGGGSSYTVFCEADTYIQADTSTVGATTTVKVSAGVVSFFRFPKPTGPVSAAVLTFYVNNVFGSSAGKKFYCWLVKPPFDVTVPERVGSLKDEQNLFWHRRNPALEPQFAIHNYHFVPGGANKANIHYMDEFLGHEVTRAALTPSERAMAGTVPIWHPTNYAEALDAENEYWICFEDTFTNQVFQEHLREGGKCFGAFMCTGVDQGDFAALNNWRQATGSGNADSFGGGFWPGASPTINQWEGHNRAPLGCTSAGIDSDHSTGRNGWINWENRPRGFMPDSILGTHARRDFVPLGRYLYLPSFRHNSTGDIYLWHEATTRGSWYRKKAQPADPEWQDSSTSEAFVITAFSQASPAVLSFLYTSSSSGTPLPPPHYRSEDEIINLNYGGSTQAAEWLAIDGSYDLRIKNVQQVLSGSGPWTVTGTCAVYQMDGTPLDTSTWPAFIPVTVDDPGTSGDQRTTFRAQIVQRASELWFVDHPSATTYPLLPGEKFLFNSFASNTGIQMMYGTQHGRGSPKRMRWSMVRTRFIINTVNLATPPDTDSNFRYTMTSPEIFGNWDGRTIVWVDGEKVFDRTGFCFRYAGPYPMAWDTELGIRRARFNMYHGGTAYPYSDAWFRLANWSVRVNAWGRPIIPEFSG